MQTFDHDKIRDRAFQLWERAGQPEGRSDEFWYQAEREMTEQGGHDSSEAAVNVDIPPVAPGRLS